MLQRFSILVLAMAVVLAMGVGVPGIITGLDVQPASAQATDPGDPPEPPDPGDPPEPPDPSDDDDGDDEGDDDEGDECDDEGDECDSENNGGSTPSRGSDSGPNDHEVSAPVPTPATPVPTPVATTIPVSDTGVVPQGGIQAGAGGTAGENSDSGLAVPAAALAALALTGGLVLRRHHQVTQ